MFYSAACDGKGRPLAQINASLGVLGGGHFPWPFPLSFLPGPFRALSGSGEQLKHKLIIISLSEKVNLL